MENRSNSSLKQGPSSESLRKTAEVLYKDQDYFVSCEDIGFEGQTSVLKPNDIAVSGELPQDGWQGWLVILGCFFAQIAVFGNLNSFGIYQNVYKSSIFESSSNVAVTFIGALQSFFVLSGGIWIPAIAPRFDIKTMVLAGGLLQSAGHLLSSFATQLWHFYLTQGLIVGLGSSLIFFRIVALPPQWFNKYRGFANGFSVLGSGLGTLSLSPLIRYLISTMGYVNTLRIMSAVLFCLVMVASALVRERVALTPKRLKILKVIGKLRNGVVACLASFMMFNNFAYFATIFFIPSFSAFIGVESGVPFISILMAFNACSCVSIGYVADRLGRLRVLMACALVCTIACGLIWPFVRSYGLMFFYVAVYGLAVGGLLNLPAVVISEFVDVIDFEDVLGLLFSFNSIGAVVGPPMLGALLDLTGGKSYLPAQIFAASCFLIAYLSLASINVVKKGGFFRKNTINLA